MKNNLFTLLLSIVLSTGISQTSDYEYTGRNTPSIKKETLYDADFVSDIMPEFGRYFAILYNEKSMVNDQFRFNEQLKLVDYPISRMDEPQKSFTKIMEFVSVKISATCNGILRTSESTGDRLTMEEKNILNSIDLGSNINIIITFKYKNQAKANLKSGDKMLDGGYTVTTIPETEAEYPGGFKKISEYLNENIFSKLTEESVTKYLRWAIVNFAVNEEGQLVDVKISRTSENPKIDNMLLEAFNKMPRWIPAKNSKGVKIKQEFSLPLGTGGC